MKKVISLILSALLVMSMLAGCDLLLDPTNPTEPTEDPNAAIREYMNADMTALEVVHEMGNGTNLGNTMEACDTNVGSIYSYNPGYYETLWGQPVTTKE